MHCCTRVLCNPWSDWIIQDHCTFVQEQVGVIDCGLFALVFATNLAFDQDVVEFQQHTTFKRML